MPETGAEREGAEHWPPDVKPITIGDMGRLGVNQKTNSIFWDGKEIVVRRIVRLGNFETFLASLGVAAAVASVILEIGKTFLGWGA